MWRRLHLSHLPESIVDLIRRSLQGETFVAAADAFEIIRSRPHGHVQAVSLAVRRLGFASLIASKACRERDLVLAMVAARIVEPAAKLATTRQWHATTLAEDFGVADATEDDLYAAVDWLLARQDTIQRKLSARHLSDGGLVLYDLSSSYFGGTHCPLAKRAYSRDGKPGTLQVNYGLPTDARSCPVAVSVHEGNTADSKTFLPEVQQLREAFGIEHMVMVGDRGMISHKAIDELREADGIGWITGSRRSRAPRFGHWSRWMRCLPACATTRRRSPTWSGRFARSSRSDTDREHHPVDRISNPKQQPIH